MEKLRALAGMAALYFLFLGAPSQGWSAYQSMGFPPAHELYTPLSADPTEPKFAFSLGAPVAQRAIARVDLGDYLGLYRWKLPGLDGAAQLSIGGAVNTRFDATLTHNLQVIDYYGNVPLDIRLRRSSTRLMFYHNSSHLGDDYLRLRDIQSVNSSWEALRAITSFHAVEPIRLYAGYTKILRTKPSWRGYQAAQGGFEIFFITSKAAHWHPYWANDMQAWQRSGWVPTWTSELGMKTAGNDSRGRGITFFGQVTTGPRPEGQFYAAKETLWLFGMKIALSDNPVSPAIEPAATGQRP